MLRHTGKNISQFIHAWLSFLSKDDNRETSTRIIINVAIGHLPVIRLIILYSRYASIHFHCSPDFQTITDEDQFSDKYFYSTRSFRRAWTTVRGIIHPRKCVVIASNEWYFVSDTDIGVKSCKYIVQWQTISGGFRITWTWWVGFRRKIIIN